MDINFGEYKFSDNKNLISIDKVCELLGNTYWANNRKIEIITELKELEGMFGILATRDAHGLYEKYGFKKVGEKYMRKDAEFSL